MGNGMRLSLSPSLQLSTRLELKLEQRAPAPLDAVRGIEGIHLARQILLKYQAVGMVIGGIAKEIWSGNTTDDALSSHKDVDVLVISYTCDRHPKQWESGVDWWVQHELDERPTNGTECGLYWTASLLFPLPAGLYLCPSELLQVVMSRERRRIERSDGSYRFQRSLSFNEVELLPTHVIQAWEYKSEAPVATHCKPQS